MRPRRGSTQPLSCFGKHVRVFTCGTAPQNPSKHDLVVKVLEQVYYRQGQMSRGKWPGNRVGEVPISTLLQKVGPFIPLPGRPDSYPHFTNRFCERAWQANFYGRDCKESLLCRAI